METSKVKRLFKAIRDVLGSSYNALHGFVFHSFKSMNRKVRSKFPVWRMEEETSEHVHSAVKVFKWAILPLSLLYVGANFYFFRENALGSMLWGLLIFFYSSFLPDLPSIYRKKKIDQETKKMQWYKKYALLLFAPLLIWFLFSGMRQGWVTTETFHDFKSLTIYGAFLFVLGFLAFGKLPIDIGNMTEILSMPLYGLIGYLTHLKVDKIW
ncbi:MAG TPA: hypothetical protein VIH48_00770 [Candidatus Bathyarchaeia archaeon]